MKPRWLIFAVGSVCLLAAAAAAALLLSSRREVTTSSGAAYRAYREAIENEHRFYLKEARVGFAKALELDPDFAMAMLGLARNSDRDQRKSLVERARKQRDHLTERERLHVEMQYAFGNGKADEGFRIARSIHEKYPDDARAAETLAGEQVAKGNTERAVAIFSELLATDPNNAGAYNQLGYYYAWRGDYERAIENFQKYRFLAPAQANPYDSMAEIQAFSGRYDEAIANLNRALAIKPDFYASYGNLGVVCEGRGEYTRAIEYYQKAADNSVSNGKRSEYLFQALWVAFRIRDRAAAERLTNQIRSLPKDEYSEVRKSGFEAARNLLENRPAEAERILRESKPKLDALLAKSIQLSGYKPYEPAWDYLMGLALTAQGKSAEAITVYEEMANPPNPWRNLNDRRWVYEGRANLAALLARRGDLERAEKLLEENRKWNPSWAPTRDAEQQVAQAGRQKSLAASK